MKDMMKKIGLMIVALAFLVMPVYASGNVTYEGHDDGFVVEPGTEDSVTDLFTEFKNVIPGDELTDSIEVINNSKEGKTVKVYLRALAPEEEDFLKEMTLKVDANSGTLFEASANETTGLSDWVLLGTLQKGGSATLNLTLNVPITMGDDYQNAKGTVNWEFKIEEDEPETPDTSVKNDLKIYIVLGGVAAVALVGLLVNKKKK